MAKTASELAGEFQTLKETYKDTLKGALEAPTYMGRMSPSSDDLRTAREVDKLKTKTQEAMRNYQQTKWYGTEDEQKARRELLAELSPEERNKEGMLMKALHGISTPLYASVGVAESLLGKGSERDMWSNVIANIKERETYGDLLRKYGSGKWSSMGLGLMLDIALDPLNWATGGAAIIPRLAKGALVGSKTGKGVLQGVKTAGIANLAGKGLKTMEAARFVPARINPLNNYIREGERAEKIRTYLGGKTEDWYEFAGIDPLEEALKLGTLTRLSDSVGERINSFFSKHDQWAKLLDYNPVKHSRGLRQMDKELAGVPLIRSGSEVPEQIRLADEAADLRRQGIDPDGPFADILSDKWDDPNYMLKGEVTKTVNILDDAEGLYRAKTGAVIRDRMATEAAITRQTAEMIQSIQDMAARKTGVDLIDNMVKKLDDLARSKGDKFYKGMEAAFDYYGRFIGHFKASKVPLNIGAYVNAALGDAVMAKMAGIDLTPDFADAVWNANKLLRGKEVDPNFLKRLTGSEETRQFITENPTAFRSAFGADPRVLQDRQELLDQLARLSRSKTEFKAGEDIIREAQVRMRELTNPYAVSRRGAQELAARGINIPSSHLHTTYGGDIVSEVMGVERNLLASLRTSKHESLRRLEDWYRNWYLKKPMELYESVDQSYKLGLFIHLTDKGITAKELNMLNRTVRMSKDDVQKVKGRDLYRVRPDAAMDASQELFMNYAAMPGLVKALRNLPLMGVPFISFTYAMAQKTAKTAAYNTAFFSKMNSLMSEISGGQDPLERKHMEGVYTSYLRDPGMLRLPFFEQNPVFLRVEQMLPYYSLNIFQQSQRDLEAPFARMVTELVDKTGLFGDPIGQVLFNYFFLPMMLQDEAPQGLFGNQLYPQEATLGQKTAYGIRDAIESGFTPPIAGIAAVPFGMASRQPAPIEGDPWYKNLPIPGVGTEEYLPHFRGKQLARAWRGQSALGIEGKENKAQRFVRTLGSFMGIPTYTTEIYKDSIKE